MALATRAFSPVFPVLASKRPACRNGYLDATDDESRIRRWWTAHPDHMVGVPTAGLLVLDLDCRPDGPDTWAWWVETAEAHGFDPLLPPVVATPSDGCHVYFAQLDGVEVRNSAGRLAPNVDVRADGGYVVAPGSRLPDGRGYELLGDGPWVLPTAPGWLVEMCAKRADPPVAVPRSPVRRAGAYALRALESECGRLAVAANGTRNHQLNTSAFALGQLVATGELDARHVAESLHAVAIRTGLGASEAEATIRSGLEAGFAQPREGR